jgi:6-phosphogluconolactonase
MKIDRPVFLEDCVSWNGSESADNLSNDLSVMIEKLLLDALSRNNRASLAVSGGSTPISLFKKISRLDIDWTSIDITLVDDRWVDPSHEDSNESLVRRYLLKYNAADASFFPLKNNSESAQYGKSLCEESLGQIRHPLDVTVLGLGIDGHTASLFPCSKELAVAMDVNNNSNCVATTPKSAPHERISLTRSAISQSNNIILHITGHNKLDTLALAMKTKDSNIMPIYAFLQEPISIYWSP